MGPYPLLVAFSDADSGFANERPKSVSVRHIPLTHPPAAGALSRPVNLYGERQAFTLGERARSRRLSFSFSPLPWRERAECVSIPGEGGHAHILPAVPGKYLIACSRIGFIRSRLGGRDRQAPRNFRSDARELVVCRFRDISAMNSSLNLLMLAAYGTSQADRSRR
jgi:hypothetical protein